MAAGKDTKAVGGKGKGSDEKGEKPVRERKRKPKKDSFEFKGDKIAPEAIDTETKLPEGYDPTAHAPLKKKQFEKTADYLYYQAALTKAKGEELVAKAESMSQKAAKVEAMGDEKTAKAMKKAERLVKQFKEARGILEAAGVDLNNLDLDL